MNTAGRLVALAGSLLAFSAVLMAAMGSHLFDMKGLQDSWKIASNIHLFNSAGLLGLGALLVNRQSRALRSGAWLIVLGTVVFCGSIYLHVITGHTIPAVTPAGGMLIMGGWLLASLSLMRQS